MYSLVKTGKNDQCCTTKLFYLNNKTWLGIITTKSKWPNSFVKLSFVFVFFVDKSFLIVTTLHVVGPNCCISGFFLSHNPQHLGAGFLSLLFPKLPVYHVRYKQKPNKPTVHTNEMTWWMLLRIYTENTKPGLDCVPLESKSHSQSH